MGYCGVKNFEQRIILEQAVRNKINPGQCPVCKSGLVPSLRPFAKVPNMNAMAISFDCPNNQDHIEAPDLDVYVLFRR
jgi:hypothetical protein